MRCSSRWPRVRVNTAATAPLRGVEVTTDAEDFYLQTVSYPGGASYRPRGLLPDRSRTSISLKAL